ncbi:hypothetical protein [uncultured Algibacter sp.]|uniref:hypothetical protein n=1 Tax=uncultured Algibacter sp. TaxID=298659 RepID=UPI003216EA65
MSDIFKLPKGITGFTSISDYFEVPKVSEELIVKSITDFTNLNNNYIFISINKPSQSNNYYSVTLLNKYENKKQIMLFNAHYNYFCTLEEEISWCEKVFGNITDSIVKHLEKLDFKYLSKLTLDKVALKSDLSELAFSEKEQIEYWESKTLGEIIFNHYD